MESTLIIVSIIAGIIGTITGVLGLVLAVFATKRQAQEQERQKRNDRLMFLADRIFDSSIPRELRQPFYEEYISMKGNGTAVKFWLLEGPRVEANEFFKETQQPA